MKASQLIKVLGIPDGYCGDGDFAVTGISCNSKKTGDGYAFFAVRGAAFDGTKFIPEAVAHGAKVVVTQGPAPSSCLAEYRDVLFVEVADIRKALGRAAVEYYADPSRSLRVAGITGTNGKTTISYLLESLLARASRPCAVLGTINYRFQDLVLPSVNTTPGPLELQQFLRTVLDAGAHYAAMEVSSHALDQGRVDGVRFCSGIFTNLTQDHLDYHGDLESYFLAKSRLFAGLPPEGWAVVNGDDPYGQRIASMTPARVITYGLGAQMQVHADGLHFSVERTQGMIHTPHGSFPLSTSLIGMHNVYNILAAAAFAVTEGVPLETISQAIAGFGVVPGRLERVPLEERFTVFVDYAHTEDALANVIRSLRAVSQGRILVMFGCGGDRDKAKRPKMGRVVSELADFCVVTSDNPRSEDPRDIIGNILSGISKDNYTVVQDREEAIRAVLGMAHPGDVVLLAGKGHEQYQVLGTSVVPFDDREVAKRCIASMNL